MSPLLLPLLVLAVSATGTALARAYALRRRLVDEPGTRRSHSVATPRGGGAGPVVGILVGCLVLAPTAPRELLLAGAGLAMVAAVGAWDDHRPLSASFRLMVHVAAGLLLALATFDPAVAPWRFAATLIATVVLVNVWNFMDGIDGIAATQGALVASAASAVGGASGALAMVVATACLGFLPFNLPRARIFLGDVGSGALGFAMAWLLARTADAAPGAALALLPALSAFLVDAGLTLGRRVLRRERWWEAHAQHLYQGLARRYGHVPVTVAYAAWTALAALTGVTARRADVTVALVAVWYTGAAVMWLAMQGRLARERGTE